MPQKTFRIGSAAAIIGAATLIIPAVAGAAPAGSLGSSESPEGVACAAISTESTPDGWGIPFDDEAQQVASYTEDAVFDEDGALRLEVDGTNDRSVSYHSAGAIKLADAIDHEIGFSERAANPTAAFQLRLTGTTENERFPESGFTTLVWAPGAEAADTSDGGTHADLQDGKWWSTSNIAGAHDRVPVLLEDIAAANPNAVVDHYGVSVGTGSAATSTLVDAVKFNGCTTNFAKNDPAPAGSLGSIGSIGSIGSLDLFGSLSTGSLGS